MASRKSALGETWSRLNKVAFLNCRFSERMDKIEYAERKADELFKHHIADMDALAKEAHQTFAFAMILLSGAFSYLLKLYDPTKAPAAQRWAWLFPVFALTVHLGVSATYLLYRGMMAKDVHTPGQLPTVLLGENAPHQDNFDDLRKAELWSRADRTKKNRQRNR